jgi:hypothetical protein
VLIIPSSWGSQLGGHLHAISAEAVGGASYFRGIAALSEPLCYVAWPPRFRLATSVRFNGSSDPVRFLQLYATAIWATGGGGHVMANWFPMATKGEAREWLLGLLPGHIMEGPLRVLRRQVCSTRVGARGPVGARGSLQPRLHRCMTSTEGLGAQVTGPPATKERSSPRD